MTVEPGRCLVCRAPLDGKRADAIYCSDWCGQLVRRTRAEHKRLEERRCKNCGGRMEGMRADAIYCGPACRVQSRRRARTEGEAALDTLPASEPGKGVTERTEV